MALYETQGEKINRHLSHIRLFVPVLLNCPLAEARDLFNVFVDTIKNSGRENGELIKLFENVVILIENGKSFEVIEDRMRRNRGQLERGMAETIHNALKYRGRRGRFRSC